MTTRLHSLDALRGVLAVVVLADHIGLLSGSHRLDLPAKVAVWLFFAMSGYVLCRAWDGRYAAFLVRRALRLWPVLAAVLTVAGLWFGAGPTWQELLLLPGDGYRLAANVDGPAWSLAVELAVTPLLPFLFVVVRTHPVGIVPLYALVASPMWLLGDQSWVWWLTCFTLGAWATRLKLQWSERVPAPLLWLGKISYSLYLSHLPLMLALGPWWGAAAALPVGWAVWWAIERPSIDLSRDFAEWFGGWAFVIHRRPARLLALHRRGFFLIGLFQHGT